MGRACSSRTLTAGSWRWRRLACPARGSGADEGEHQDAAGRPTRPGAYWRSNAAQTPAARSHADAIPAPAWPLRAGAS